MRSVPPEKMQEEAGNAKLGRLALYTGWSGKLAAVLRSLIERKSAHGGAGQAAHGQDLSKLARQSAKAVMQSAVTCSNLSACRHAACRHVGGAALRASGRPNQYPVLPFCKMGNTPKRHACFCVFLANNG